MRATFFGAFCALLAGTTVATVNDIAKFPGSTDFQIARPVRRDPLHGDLVRKDIDHTEPFNWVKTNEDLINLNIGNNRFEVDCNQCQLQGSTRFFFDDKFPDVLDSLLNISFTQTSAYVNVDILVGSGGEQSIPIWSIGGVDLPEFSVNLGLGFYIDLVFSVEGELEATGGFQFTIPEGSWLAATVNGDIVGNNFAGAVSEMLPWEVTRGSTTLKVALRVRTELGLSAEIPLIGAGAEVGVYLNLIELVAHLEADPNDEVCELELTESWNINAGAFLNLGVNLGNQTFGAMPTESTTFYTGPTLTQCLDDVTSTDVIVTPTDAPTPGAPNVPDRIVAVTPTSDYHVTKTWIPDVPQVTPTSSSSSFTTVKYHNATITSPPKMHTSTVYSTRVYTVTSCAAHVINCPADWREEIVVTQIVDLYTTVCPVDEEQPVPPPTTAPYKTVTITGGYTLTVCPTPIVHVFTPPTGVEPPKEHKTTITVHHNLPGETQKSTSIIKSVTVEDEHDTWLPNSVTSIKTVIATTVPSYGEKSDTTATPAQPTTKTTETPIATVPVTAAGVTEKPLGTLIGGAVVLMACLLAL